MALNAVFEAELRQLINKHSVDHALNTPDFILAESIVAELTLQRIVQQKRAAWLFSPGGEDSSFEKHIRVELV